MSERILTEVHAHTAEVSPCGKLSAREVVEALHAKGYGALVITDHFVKSRTGSREAREKFLSGFRAARQAGEAHGMTVLPGMEVTFHNAREDYLVYGLTEEDILDLPDDLCEQGLGALHALAKEKGFLIYQAHPFRPGLLPASPPYIDGMEIFNGNPRHNSQNRLASAFAARHNLRVIAGSDIHQQGDEGTAGLFVPAEALTPKGFAGWLRQTPHPRIHYQEPPVNGIRYLTGAVPGKDMLAALYTDAGWTSYTEDMPDTVRGIKKSLRVVTAWDDTTLVGMARAVGDGHTILYVQDILVLGAFRRRGIGRALMRRLLAPYMNVRQIVLITDEAPDVRAFYKTLGFSDISAYHCTGFIRLK